MIRMDFIFYFQTLKVMTSQLLTLTQQPTDMVLALSDSMQTSIPITLMLNNQQPVTSSPLVNRFILVFPLKIFQAVSHSLSWIALSQIQTELTFHTTLSKTSAQMSTQEPILPAIICRKILFSYIIKVRYKIKSKLIWSINYNKYCYYK